MSFKEEWSNPYIRTVILLRIGAYLFIPFYPLEAIALSIILDMLDWHILSWGNVPKEVYHKIDKPLDYIQYIFMIPMLIGTHIFIAYMGLLIWRTIGHYLYSKYQKRFVFILFPNIAEYIAIVYLVSERFHLNIDPLSTQVFTLILIFKLIQEIWIHYLAKGSSYDMAKNLKAFLYRKY
ncbi:MAG TPA: hypothetical protein PLV59_03375 [Candidatus Dojkabacteria bacterium]|nr:hypothetical protein [Candidatus Dojkabacteria bacterium]